MKNLIISTIFIATLTSCESNKTISEVQCFEEEGEICQDLFLACIKAGCTANYVQDCIGSFVICDCPDVVIIK